MSFHTNAIHLFMNGADLNCNTNILNLVKIERTMGGQAKTLNLVSHQSIVSLLRNVIK